MLNYTIYIDSKAAAPMKTKDLTERSRQQKWVAENSYFVRLFRPPWVLMVTNQLCVTLLIISSEILFFYVRTMSLGHFCYRLEEEYIWSPLFVLLGETSAQAKSSSVINRRCSGRSPQVVPLKPQNALRDTSLPSIKWLTLDTIFIHLSFIIPEMFQGISWHSNILQEM